MFKIKVGEIYLQRDIYGISTEVWIFNQTEFDDSTKLYVEALITVRQGDLLLSATVGAVDISEIAGLSLIGFQAIKHKIIPMPILAIS